MNPPRPQDLVRLCEHWLHSGPAGDSAAQRLRTALRALEEVLGADGAAVVAPDALGFIATGVLEGDGNAERVDGADGEPTSKDGLLVRRRADDEARRLCVAFHFPRRTATEELAEAVAVAARAIAEWSKRRLGQVNVEQTFAGYTLLAPLDEGGMGQIWLARPAQGGAPVALKRIWKHLAKDRGFVELFAREVHAASQVEHPAVVRILEYGVTDEQPYLTMEYLRGASLARVVVAAQRAGRDLTADVVLALALRTCEGLSAVHARGVVHCDVSPQNLFVTFDGEAKVIDFGLARRAGRRDGEHEKPRGKVGYVAPEHLLHTPPDPRLDVYGLGVTLYELLTRSTVATTVKLYGAEEREALRAAGIAGAVADVVMEAVQFDPAKRVATTEELARKLREAAAVAGLVVAEASRIATMMRDVLGDAEAHQKRLVTGRLDEATTSHTKTAALQ